MEERNCLSYRIADTVYRMLMCLDGKLSARERVETPKAIQRTCSMRYDGTKYLYSNTFGELSENAAKILQQNVKLQIYWRTVLEGAPYCDASWDVRGDTTFRNGVELSLLFVSVKIGLATH